MEALARNAHLIIIDLSDLSDNVRWELQLCREQHLLGRVLFVVSEERYDEVRHELAHAMVGRFQPSPYVYNARSLGDAAAFMREIARILARWRLNTDGDAGCPCV